jgi:hypothetical protein
LSRKAGYEDIAGMANYERPNEQIRAARLAPLVPLSPLVVEDKSQCHSGFFRIFLR